MPTPIPRQRSVCHSSLSLLFAALLGSLSLTSWASDTWNAPYAEKDAALQASGDLQRGEAAFVICQGCHRAGALGRTDGSYPRLAGQHRSVLIKQLTDVRSGRRVNPKMLPFSDEHALSTQDIADIGSYLQALPVPDDHGKGPGLTLDAGQKLYQRDCQQCHGAQGQGDAQRFYPRLNGQHYRYLVRETRMIRDQQRHNGNPEMREALRNYSNDDIDAVTDFIARLPINTR